VKAARPVPAAAVGPRRFDIVARRTFLVAMGAAGAQAPSDGPPQANRVLRQDRKAGFPVGVWLALPARFGTAPAFAQYSPL
jgi:hypothetical protein